MMIDDMMRECCCEHAAPPDDGPTRRLLEQMREEVAYLRGGADGMRYRSAADAVDGARTLPNGRD